ncbi:MAG: hypothetical protein WKG00_29965 [Polyangiaceae bacterium]
MRVRGADARRTRGCARADAEQRAHDTERLWIAGGITAGAGGALAAAALLGLALRAPRPLPAGWSWQPSVAGHPGISARLSF